jgi:hypothetical protein
MKKYILILPVLLLFNTLNYAQFALGGGVAYTTNTNDVGAQIKSQYTFAENWRAEFSMDGYVTDNNFSYYGDFNLNINYIFAQTETLQLHALVGGTVFYGSTRNVDFVQKGRAQGVNIGAGVQYQAKPNLNGYIDSIFTFTDFGNPGLANRLLFTMGVIYFFEN